MQKFQNLSTKSKIAIVTVATVGIFGAGVVVAPTITGNEQNVGITPIVRETPIDATPTFDFIHCIKHHGRDGNGGGAVQEVCFTPTPTDPGSPASTTTP